MSATRSRLGCGSLILLLSLGVAVELSESFAAGGETSSFPPDGVVRVQFKRKLPGILQGEKLIPQATVVEITEFSGVVIDARGYIASYIGSAWVDMGSFVPEVSVRFADGKTAPADFVGVDERISLAVVRAAAASGRSAVLGRVAAKESVRLVFWSSLDQDGKEKVYSWDALTGPEKKSMESGRWGVTVGQVLGSVPTGFDSAAMMKLRIDDEEPGPLPNESGGAVLLDGASRFLGFVTRVERSGLSRSILALHLLPVLAARDSLKEVVDRNQSIRAGWLGVWIGDNPDQVRVDKVIPGEPAERAGIEAGDVIIKFNETAIWSRDQFIRLLRSLGPDTKVELTVERRGNPRKLSAVLGSWPASERPRFAWAIQIPELWTSSNGSSAESRDLRLYKVPLDPPDNLGWVLDPLTPQLAQYLKVPSGRGLLVKSVTEGSPVGRFGFRAGDVLTKINDQNVESAADIRRIVEASRAGVLVIVFFRDGVKMTRKVALH